MYHFLYSSDYWELCLASHHLTTSVNTLWVLSLTTELMYCMCSCVGWMGEEIGLHAVCDWSYLKSQSVTTHSLHVLQWCCQLYTTSYRGRHCIWWVSVYGVCVSVCVCVWVCMVCVCVCMVSVCECVCVCVCVWWVCVRVSVLDSKAFFKFVIVAIFFSCRTKVWSHSSISSTGSRVSQSLQYQSPITKISRKIAVSLVWFSTTDAKCSLVDFTDYISRCVCVCVCRYTRFTDGCTRGLLVESWAHNPEDTGSDPRAGV